MTQEQQGSVELHAPGGFWGRVSGLQLYELLIVVLIIGCSAFIWWADEQRVKVFMEQHKTTQTLLGNVIQNQTLIILTVNDSAKAAADASSVQTYILTLTQQQREALKLTMPPALRRMQNGR